MFHFSYPAYLLLALIVPPLLWWWWRRRSLALRYPTTGLMIPLTAGSARRARWGGAVLRSMALIALAVALAGPRWPDASSRIETEGIALVLVVDVSKSMDTKDFDWQGKKVARLEAVKRVLRLFVAGGKGSAETADGIDATHFAGRPTDLIGLVTFAHRPEHTFPLTLSHSVLLTKLDRVQVVETPTHSETNLSDSVAVALKRLNEAGPRRKVMVLLTDGEHNVDPTVSGWSPRGAARVARSLDIPIYTLDAGKPLDSVTSSDGRGDAIKSLEEMAEISGGHYLRARDTASLLNGFQEIDRLERSDIQSFQYRRYHEAFSWFALVSFVCYSLALALEMTLWRRLP